LACGLGAVGLAAAGSKAKEVLLTDADGAVLECAAEAAAATGLANGVVATRVFDWADAEHRAAIACRDEPFDLFLASDVLYDAAAPQAMAALLDALLIAPGAQALIADPTCRTYRTAFIMAAADRGLKVVEGPLPGPEAMQLLSVARKHARLYDV